MATNTPNYGLTKPATTDNYDIGVPNGNMDKIDTEMKKGEDHRNDTVAHMTQTQKDTLASAVQNATIGGNAVPKNGQQLQFPAYPTIPGSLKNPNALTVSQGYGGQTGSYDGSSPMGISIPVVTLHTASPSGTLADGELYGVY